MKTKLMLKWSSQSQNQFFLRDHAHVMMKCESIFPIATIMYYINDNLVIGCYLLCTLHSETSLFHHNWEYQLIISTIGKVKVHSG